MVPAIIQLARGLNLRIVAEGVEKEAQSLVAGGRCGCCSGVPVWLRFVAGGLYDAASARQE
jgi:hypothetical protein